MIQDIEDNFPRGGKTVPISLKRKSKNDALFSNAPKKQKTEKKEKSAVDYRIPLTNCRMLSKQSILEGMTSLACIKKINENSLEVELPGLIVCKVMIIKVTDENSVILGSLSPKDVNSGRRHNSFKKGELIWATVKSELDHGYQLECGIPKLRIFLPNQHIEDTKLEIGQPIWCKIHDAQTDKSASTLRVGIKRQHIDSVLNDATVPLSSILPGTKVEVYVERVAKNGIYCTFLDDYSGFIHESQLEPALKNLNNIKESSMLMAYLLYVEDISKIAHLSMRSLHSTYELVFERGTKVSAEVIGRNEIGIYFKLNKKVKGWISNKRILSTLKTESNNGNYISDKFPKGSKHQCVVLSYNHMDRVYVCGVEKDLLKEKYFSSKDLKVGDLVDGKIMEIKPNGIVLAVGQVRCFVPNIHLTDVLYSDNIKKKFVVGKKIRARVFSSNEKSVILTLKSSFLTEDEFFTDLKSVKVNHIYSGMVLKAKHHGLVLTFNNNIEGFVPLKEFNFQVTEEYKENPSSFFYSGQVIKVRVTEVKSDKALASLKLEGKYWK